MSQSYGGLVTFVLAGFLLASIVIFGVTALPEIVPFLSPVLKTGDVIINVTSSSTVEGFEGDRIYLVVNKIEFRRVGVSGGAWLNGLAQAREVELVAVGRRPMNLGDIRLPIGEYNLARISLGSASFHSSGSNVTLKVPSNIALTPVDFVVTETLPVTLLLDIAFDEVAVYSFVHRFIPYPSMVVEQEPSHEPTMERLHLIASFGPETRSPGDDSSFKFEIARGFEVENYMLYAKGGSSGGDAFDVEVQETGEFWYDISGEAWFLGGNLTAGSYTVNVHVIESAPGPLTFLLKIFRLPRVPSDLSRPGFSGLSRAEEAVFPPINEVGVYFENMGAYNIYLAVGTGDYEFLADNGPIAVVNSNRTVTLELSEGLHTFQILPDYSGSGRDTSWAMVITWIPTQSGPSFSSTGIAGIVLLIAAASAFVLNYGLTRIAARRIERSSSRPTNTPSVLC